MSVTRLDTGETFEEDVDVLVAARGNLNEPKWPSIPGFETFKGEKIHSASWKEESVLTFAQPLLPSASSECHSSSYPNVCPEKMLTHNNSYDFENKRVVVIGGGSSSIQIVPELRKAKGSKLSVFVRHKTWITNPFGHYIMGQMGWDTKQIASKNAEL